MDIINLYFQISGIILLQTFPLRSSAFIGDGISSIEVSVCQSEHFTANCRSDQVIMINKAQYGRMVINRCVQTDFGYIGCAYDVTDVLEVMCSGHHTCSFRVFDDAFPNTLSCHADLKSYLSVEYACIKVETPPPANKNCNKANTLTSKQGYISNLIAHETSCGTSTAPWKILGQKGQVISLFLYDFSKVSHGNISQFKSTSALNTNVCNHAFAQVKEKGKQIHIICEDSQAFKRVYTSTTHELFVTMLPQTNEMAKKYILIKYQVQGCLDPHAPENGWVKRDGMTSLFGCNYSNSQWTLTCAINGSKWIGKQYNCTTENAQIGPDAGGYFGQLSLSLSVVIVIIIALAIAIGLLVLAVGLYLMRRKQPDSSGHEAMRLYGAAKYHPSDVYGKHQVVYDQGSSQCSTQCMIHGSGREYEYGTVIYSHQDYFQSPDVVQVEKKDSSQRLKGNGGEHSIYSQSRNKTFPAVSSQRMNSSLGSLRGSPVLEHGSSVVTQPTGHHIGEHSGIPSNDTDSIQQEHHDVSINDNEECDICYDNQRHGTTDELTMQTFKPALPQL